MPSWRTSSRCGKRPPNRGSTAYLRTGATCWRQRSCTGTWRTNLVLRDRFSCMRPAASRPTSRNRGTSESFRLVPEYASLANIKKSGGDAYSGTSLNDSDPGGNPGFFSGQDGQGTYLFLHTGDSRANGFHLAPGDIHHIHVVQPATTGSASAPSSTASKVAVGTVAAAGATAAGIGVYAWMHGIAYSYAVGKAYDATIGKVVDKAKKALRGR